MTCVNKDKKGVLETTSGRKIGSCEPVPEERCTVLPVPSGGTIMCVTVSENLVCNVVCNDGTLESKILKLCHI